MSSAKQQAGKPEQVAKPHRTAAMIAALVLFALAFEAGPPGIGAIIAVLLLLPFSRAMDRKAPAFMIPGSFLGGLAGAFYHGSAFAPRGRTMLEHLGFFVGDSVLQVLFIGVFTAGFAGILIAAAIRWSGTLRTTPYAIKNGLGALFAAILYFLIASIAMPEFQDARVKGIQKSMTSDLRNLAASQRTYHDRNGAFSSSLENLDSLRLGDGNHIVIKAFTNEWSATATNDVITTTCVGSATALQPDAAPTPFEPVCTQHRRWF